MNNAPAPSWPDATRAPTVAERKALALQRLDASRTLLIQRLYPVDDEAPAGPSADDAITGLPRMLATLMTRVQRDGWAQGSWRALRALSRRWWKRQPWHAPVDLVAGTLAREARPLLRRHPWACLAAAAALGAGLAWARPWVSRTVRQQTQDLPRQLGGLLWQQLAQAPVQLALAGALSTWLTQLLRETPARPPAPPDNGPLGPAAPQADTVPPPPS